MSNREQPASNIQPALVGPALVTPPPPPPQSSFDEVLDEILTNLALGQLDIATRRLASIPDLRTATPTIWKRKILVGELVRIASSIQPMLLRHLTSAIRADELSTTKRFHSYARTYPDRAYLERAIIRRMAPHIAIAIGDALLAELMTKDCTTSQEMAATVTIRATAPERARQVLSVRLDRLGAPRKRSLLE